jgi:hypothetical protein
MRRLLVLFVLVLFVPLPAQAIGESTTTQDILDKWEVDNEIHILIQRDWYFPFNVTGDTTLVVTQNFQIEDYNSSIWLTAILIKEVSLSVIDFWYENDTLAENMTAETTLYEGSLVIDSAILENSSVTLFHEINSLHTFEIHLQSAEMPIPVEWTHYYKTYMDVNETVYAYLHLWYIYEAVFENRPQTDFTLIIIVVAIVGFTVYVLYVTKIREWLEERKNPPQKKVPKKTQKKRDEYRQGRKVKKHKDKKGYRKPS